MTTASAGAVVESTYSTGVARHLDEASEAEEESAHGQHAHTGWLEDAQVRALALRGGDRKEASEKKRKRAL